MEMSVVHVLLWILLVCFSDTAFAQSNGELRLAKGHPIRPPLHAQGRLEIYLNGQWGTVCDDFFDRDDANVACRQLGWEGASHYATSSHVGFKPGSGPIWLDDVECSRQDMRHLLSCDHAGPGAVNCDHSEDVVISCYPTHIYDNPDELQVRLMEGGFPSQGRVEVYCNGEWGTICDEGGFGQEEANTICRQLGYTHADEYDHLSLPGNISQPIWLRSFSCGESNESLEDCSAVCPNTSYRYSPVGVACFHDDDITIQCNYNPNQKDPVESGSSASSITVIGMVSGASILGACCCIICCVAIIAFATGRVGAKGEGNRRRAVLPQPANTKAQNQNQSSDVIPHSSVSCSCPSPPPHHHHDTLPERDRHKLKCTPVYPQEPPPPYPGYATIQTTYRPADGYITNTPYSIDF